MVIECFNKYSKLGTFELKWGCEHPDSPWFDITEGGVSFYEDITNESIYAYYRKAVNKIKGEEEKAKLVINGLAGMKFSRYDDGDIKLELTNEAGEEICHTIVMRDITEVRFVIREDEEGKCIGQTEHVTDGRKHSNFYPVERET